MAVYVLYQSPQQARVGAKLSPLAASAIKAYETKY